jgi:molybdenum cofactor cytidylyltransferase
MIRALVLAAGESRRMGKPKLLLPFGDKTIIEYILDNIRQSKADRILVVLGSHRKEILDKIGDRTVETVINHRYREGMLSSIQTGFAALSDDTTAVLVYLGDQPLIPSSVADGLIEAYKGARKGIVLPVYKKRRGHPILIDIKHKQEILDLSPDIGLRALVHNHPDDILEVEVDTPHILKDIDKPEDYARELKKMEEI